MIKIKNFFDFINWIGSIVNCFGLFNEPKHITIDPNESIGWKLTPDEMHKINTTFTTHRELSAQDLNDINLETAKIIQRREYSNMSGYMMAVFETGIKPIKPKVKIERCKSCGQNEAEYTYSNGIFKCNYCGSLSGEVK